MSLKVYKPTTPARRKTSVVDYNKVLTGDAPEKSLIVRKKNHAGRNDRGLITIRHRGGGAKKMVRKVDFKREFPNGFKVKTIEYDPNRTAFISLVVDIKSGQKAYVLYTKGMEVGKVYTPGALQGGNTITLGQAPVGAFVSQVEINPNSGATMVRAAGTYAVVTAKEDKYVTIKLPSGEVRKFLAISRCVVNRVANEEHGLVRIGKAGRVRRMGIRPTVRGKVMNPVDHPHGGGEARNSIGMAYPKTPWGKHALGVRTRQPKKASNSVIVSRRKKNK